MSIKGLVNLRPKKIPLDGCELWVVSPTMGMLLRMEEAAGERKREIQAVRELLSKCVVDSRGERVFNGPDDPEIDDLPTEVAELAGELLTKTGSKFNGSAIEKN